MPVIAWTAIGLLCGSVAALLGVPHVVPAGAVLGAIVGAVAARKI